MKKRVNLRAQASLFIILGIIIFIIFGSIYGYFGYKLNRDIALSKEYFSQEDIRPQVENIYSNIFLCIDVSGRESLRALGKQGGYYKKPTRALVFDDFFIPYHYFEGEYYTREPEEVIIELEKYMNESIERCFNELNFQNYEIKYTIPKIKITLKDDEIIYLVDSSFAIKREGRTLLFNPKENPNTQKSKLNDILDVTRYILDSHRIDPKKYCLTCVDKLAKEKDVYVKYSVFKDSVLVIISENITDIEPYSFNFLNKYTGKEISDDFKLTGDSADKIPIYEGGIKS